MGESSASYIHMVQHLIEECIIFKMSREECVEALSKHANILPVITSTVWNALEEENKEFFEAYANGMKKERGECEEEEEEIIVTSQRLQNLIFNSTTPKD